MTDVSFSVHFLFWTKDLLRLIHHQEKMYKCKKISLEFELFQHNFLHYFSNQILAFAVDEVEKNADHSSVFTEGIYSLDVCGSYDSWSVSFSCSSICCYNSVYCVFEPFVPEMIRKRKKNNTCFCAPAYSITFYFWILFTFAITLSSERAREISVRGFVRLIRPMTLNGSSGAPAASYSPECHTGQTRDKTHNSYPSKPEKQTKRQQKHFITGPRQSRRMKSATRYFSSRLWWSEPSKHTGKGGYGEGEWEFSLNISHTVALCSSPSPSHNPLVRVSRQNGCAMGLAEPEGC